MRPRRFRATSGRSERTTRIRHGSPAALPVRLIPASRHRPPPRRRDTALAEKFSQPVNEATAAPVMPSAVKGAFTLAARR